MKIEWLINNTYQVIDEDDAVLYQGDVSQCVLFIIAKRAGMINA